MTCTNFVSGLLFGSWDNKYCCWRLAVADLETWTLGELEGYWRLGDLESWRELESLLLQTCCCVEISLIYEPEVLNHIIIVTVLYFCWSVREQLSCIVLMSFHVSWSRGHLGSLDIWILCFVWVICALINWVICCPIFLLNT